VKRKSRLVQTLSSPRGITTFELVCLARCAFMGTNSGAKRTLKELGVAPIVRVG